MNENTMITYTDYVSDPVVSILDKDNNDEEA